MSERLSFGEQLIREIRSEFSKIPDHRQIKRVTIGLTDALLSGFAVFLLKFSSLLHFEEEIRKKDRRSNLKNIFDVKDVPSDTQMREILDEVDPNQLREAYKSVFRKLQRAKALERFAYYNDHYLLSLDGTGSFSSDSVHCDQCLKKERTNKTIYFHQMLGAAIVHPDQKVVVPVFPEPIQRQDKNDFNDVERVAVRRFLTSFRTDHPKLKIIVVQDSLHCNAKQIRDLQSHSMSYILSAKPGICKHLFSVLDQKEKEGAVVWWQKEELTGQKIKKKITHKYRFINQVQLNRESPDIIVNFLEYWQKTVWENNGESFQEETHFSWVTDIPLSIDTLDIVMKGGRARWKIENETFNTLKNQGYNFSHNFGHGYKYLTNTFACLMMLAFLIDQAQQLCCKIFQMALQISIRRIRLWDYIRDSYCRATIQNWTMLLQWIAAPEKWRLIPDTS